MTRGPTRSRNFPLHRFYLHYPEVIFVSHDASATGAPMLLLTLLEWWQRNGGPPFRVVLRSGGILEPRFRSLGRVWNMNLRPVRTQPTSVERSALLSFCGPDVRLIYGNTGAVGDVLEALASIRCPVLVHIHELERMLSEGIGPERFQLVTAHATGYVAVSNAVANNLVRKHAVSSDLIDVIPGFLPDDYASEVVQKAFVGECVRPLILGVGTTDWRKAPDLFVEMAAQLIRQDAGRRARFVWVGAETETGQIEKLRRQAAECGVSGQMEFVGGVSDVRPYYRDASIFALCSREDPYPLVCLEAAAHGVPIVCFAGAGGMPDFVRQDAGRVVSHLDVVEMALAIGRLLADPVVRYEAGRCGRERINRENRATAGGQLLLTLALRMMARERTAT